MSTFSKHFEEKGFKPRPAGSKTVWFDIEEGSLLESLALQLSREVDRIGKNSRIVITSDQFHSYLESILILRKCQVAGISLKQFRNFKWKLSVPSLFSSALSQVGNVLDAEKLISFRLYTAQTTDDIKLTMNEMSDISNILSTLEKDGFSMVDGLPNDTTGDLGYLAIQTISDELLSYRSDPYVNGFWASLLKPVWLKDETGKISTQKTDFTSDLGITYGYTHDYLTYIPSLIKG